jgi:MoaA/NifB/PqqE/SkfB family radical SAM enzyme
MEVSFTKLTSRLLLNGLRFRYLKWLGKPGRPQALSLEITHDCVAKCVMCNIWKIPHDVPNLSVEAWLDLLSSDLFSDLRELDITGGEPFLRKDLPDLFSGICNLRQNHLKQLRSIAVTTNGLLTDHVLEDTEKILPMLAGEGLELVMVCAVDAIGGIHDKIRNVKDAWPKVNETIEGMMALREKFSNLTIGLKTTILPINVGELEKIMSYAKSRNLFTIISPRIMTEGRYLNKDLERNLLFSEEDVDNMIRFYQSEMFRWSYHGDRLALYLQTKPIEELFNSVEASKIRRMIGKYPECKRCTEPGLERYALPYEGFSYLNFLIKMGRKEFLQFHQHMGLDKYLN